MPKIKLECFQCGAQYNIQDSSANEPSMFCSDACELRENAMLAEGNEIIHKAEENNPGAFGKTLASLGFSMSEATQQPTTIDRVNSLFDRLNKYKTR